MPASAPSLKRLASTLLLCTAVIATAAPAGNPVAPAAHSCETEYDTASIAIETEVQNQGDRQKLKTKLDNAWRAFWKDRKLDVANQQLDVLQHLLQGNATKGVTEGSREVVQEAAGAFRACINGESPIGTATLTVRAFNFDESVADGKGAPAGSGVYLYVDGKHLATTGADGTATLTVPAGLISLQAIVPSSALAETTVDIGKGASLTVDLILDDSKEVTSPVQLSVSGVTGNVVSANAESFTIDLLDAGVLRPVVAIADVSLEDDLGNTLAVLSDEFQVSADGRLVPIDVARIVNAMRPYAGRQLTLRVMAEDAAGFTLSGTMPLYLGQYTLQLTLVAPASNPGLPVSGIQVAYRLMGTELTLHATSDASGVVSFGLVPMGNASIESVTMQDGRYYYGQSTFFMTQPSMVHVIMTHADDVANGAPASQVGPLAGMASTASASGADEATDAHRQSLHDAANADGNGLVSPLATTSLRVGAGAANQQVSNSVVMSVAQGTKTVVLRYQVTTLEYPYYVQQQSVFNDTWSLSVRARQSGAQLFHSARNVNSQLSQAPIWRANGSTGYIEQSLDLTGLTAQGPAELLLAATAMNVADSLLPTIVEADLSDDPNRLTLDEIVSDTLAGTKGDSRSYSIPLQGATNDRARWFTLRITKPEGAQISKVKAELQHGSATMATIFEEAPGPNVQVVDDRTLRVRVTFHTTGGTVDTVPPPAHGITYKFTVFAQHEGAEISDDGISAAKRALWRMQEEWRSPARRYGMRDAGGDDWLAVSTWNYIQRHGGLLTRIDDISGEHGRNIGHETHDVGTDLDLYHVYTFAGASSGSDNYNRLRNTLVRVMSLPAEQTQADRAALTAWAAQTRTRFAALIDSTDAQRLYYAIGSAHAASGISLPRGWARALLVDGSVSASGSAFDTGLGAWNYGRAGQITYNAVHNSHLHIKRPRER